MSYRHQILVSHPDYALGERAKVLVYVLEHSQRGALGLAVNQKAHEQFLNSRHVLPTLPEGISPHFGGPEISSQGFFTLHKKSVGTFEKTTQMGSDLFLTVSSDIFQKTLFLPKPELCMKAIFGIIRWAPWELDTQVIQDLWFNVPYHPDLLFTSSRESGDQTWEKAFHLLGISSANLHLENLGVH